MGGEREREEGGEAVYDPDYGAECEELAMCTIYGIWGMGRGVWLVEVEEEEEERGEGMRRGCYSRGGEGRRLTNATHQLIFHH